MAILFFGARPFVCRGIVERRHFRPFVRRNRSVDLALQIRDDRIVKHVYRRLQFLRQLIRPLCSSVDCRLDVFIRFF